MRILIVCQKCREHTTDEATLEFNFAENKVYFICPKCRFTNELDLNPKTYLPLPKPRRM